MPKSVVIGILALLATLWVGCTQSEPTSTLVPTPKLVAIPTRTAHTHAHCHTYAHSYRDPDSYSYTSHPRPRLRPLPGKSCWGK